MSSRIPLIKPLYRGLFFLSLGILAVACDIVANEPTPTLLPTAVPPSPVAQETTVLPATPVATDTLAPTEPASQTATPLPTLEATATAPMPEPTATPLPSVLPAALYFISTDGQIMRQEADGQTLTLITQEVSPITDYDVASGGQKIAYVSGNNLYESAADGSESQLLVEVGPFPYDETGANNVTLTIRRPRYSPDGTQIAFGLDGVNLIQSGTSSEYEVLLASDPFPDFTNPDFEPQEGPIRFFRPEAWSPDGSKILTQFGYFPEGGGMSVLNVADGSLVEHFNPSGINCCDWTWSPDSLGGYIASDQFAYGAAGLAQVDAVSGESTTLIMGMLPDAPPPEGPVTQFRTPLDLGDGSLLVFVAAVDFQSGQSPYTIASYDLAADQITPLSEERYPISQMRWFGDGQGAAVVVEDLDIPGYGTGQLYYLAIDGQPALPLPAVGSSPIWANGD